MISAITSNFLFLWKKYTVCSLSTSRINKTQDFVDILDCNIWLQWLVVNKQTNTKNKLRIEIVIICNFFVIAKPVAAGWNMEGLTDSLYLDIRHDPVLMSWSLMSWCPLDPWPSVRRRLVANGPRKQRLGTQSHNSINIGTGETVCSAFTVQISQMKLGRETVRRCNVYHDS